MSDSQRVLMYILVGFIVFAFGVGMGASHDIDAIEQHCKKAFAKATVADTLLVLTAQPACSRLLGVSR